MPQLLPYLLIIDREDESSLMMVGCWWLLKPGITILNTIYIFSLIYHERKISWKRPNKIWEDKRWGSAVWAALMGSHLWPSLLRLVSGATVDDSTLTRASGSDWSWLAHSIHMVLMSPCSSIITKYIRPAVRIVDHVDLLDEGSGRGGGGIDWKGWNVKCWYFLGLMNTGHSF